MAVPQDNGLSLRRAVVTKLRASPTVVALVPSVRIYGEESPAMPVWPFIRYGFDLTTAYEQSCGAGSEHRITVHAFAQGPGTDAVRNLAQAIVAVLNDADITLAGLRLVRFDWIGTQFIRDSSEASAYHAAIEFTVQLIGVS